MPQLYTHVPVEMCNWCVKNKQESQLRLFIYLKLAHPSGKIFDLTNEVKSIAKNLGITERAVKNQFKRLESLDWVKYDERLRHFKTKSYFNLRQNYDWLKKQNYTFYQDNLEKPRFTALLGAILITQLVQSHNYNKSNALRKGSADKSFRSYKGITNEFAEVAISGISKVFGISTNKAARLKKEAIKHGLIDIKKNFTPLESTDVNLLKKTLKMNDKSGYIVVKNNKLFLQGIDLMKSHLKFKRRRISL